MATKKQGFRDPKKQPNNYPDEVAHDFAEGRKGHNRGRKCDPHYTRAETRGMNDAAWYAENEFLLKDAASLAFSNALGTPYDLKGKSHLSTELWTPGIMGITTAPAVGISVGAESPVNVAARNIYSFVRHANSGHSNYDSPDLMLYLLAMDQVYSFYAWCVRAYGTLRVYNQKNRYLARALITAMGFNYDDILANLADFRYFINSFAVKAGSLCVPNTMSYFTRHAWMYSNVYQDSPSAKSQIYVFKPYDFLHFEPVSSGTGGSLVVSMASGGSWQGLNNVTFAQVRTLGKMLIEPVITSEDMNIMSGDVLKAFGDSGVLKVNSVAEDYVVLPVYNEEVLSQIENITVVGNPYDATEFNITQSPTGDLQFNPRFSDPTERLLMDKLFNMHKDDVSPAEVMVASRLTPIATTRVEHDTFMLTPLSTCGTELVTNLIIYGYNTHAGAIQQIVNYGMFNLPSGSATGDVLQYQEALNTIAKYVNFDWAPMLALIWGANDAKTFRGLIGDEDNYTIVNSDDLFKMHETALLSEFNVPAMGAWSRKVTK